MIQVAPAQQNNYTSASSAAHLPLYPTIKFVSMASKISKIDNALKTMQEEDANDRLKLQQLIEQADNLSARVRNNFQRCINIRGEINISTGESSVLAVERKPSPRKVHWCGPGVNNPEKSSRLPQRKRSAQRSRNAGVEPIKLPMTPNNMSFGHYEKAVVFRRRLQSPEKEKRGSRSMIVTGKQKAKSWLETDREQVQSNRTPANNRARAHLRANLLSFVILLTGLMLIYKLL